MSRRKILISGASIAGPTCAYWLSRAGFDVTVVERTSEPRAGGYPIDIRGPAVTVLERMGLLGAIREHHIEMRKMVFIDGRGRKQAEVLSGDLTGGEEGSDLEVRRGSLTGEMFAASKDKIDYRFNDSIAALSQDEDGVDIEFESGATDRFDVVIAADGLHSNTRNLVFGPEANFHRYMGYFFGLFTVPNSWKLDGEAQLFSDVKRCAVLYGVSGSENISAMLTVALPEPPYDLLGDPEGQRAFFQRIFADVGGVVPEILDGLEKADDLFCDMVSQTHISPWWKGRVALIGDAVAAPSFMTGQGTSLAIVEGYMLARALAEHADHRAAFAAYEEETRPFVERNQALAKPGGWEFIPNTRLAAIARRIMLRMMPLLRRFVHPGSGLRAIHNSLDLPPFPDVTPAETH